MKHCVVNRKAFIFNVTQNRKTKKATKLDGKVKNFDDLC